MGVPRKDGLVYALNITTIILRSTSSNLETLIRPITILDNILSNNIGRGNPIPDNAKDVLVLNDLFSSFLSRKGYAANQYISDSFMTFITSKQKIRMCLYNLNKYCKNQKSLKLIFNDMIQVDKDAHDKYKYDEMIKKKNQNLLNSNVLKLFKNVTYLEIRSARHPVSLESLLELINGTQIREVEISGHNILLSLEAWSSLADIRCKYKKANFNMEFRIKYGKTRSLFITHID